MTDHIEVAAKAAFRAAQTVYRADHDHFPLRHTWEATTEEIRAGWREIAAAVLAVGGSGEVVVKPLEWKVTGPQAEHEVAYTGIPDHYVVARHSRSKDAAQADYESRVRSALVLSKARDEWVAWDGGECPVGRGQDVRVRFSNGLEGAGRPYDFQWHHSAHPGFLNIVAYRLAAPVPNGVPEGWKLVPVDITEEMWTAFFKARDVTFPAQQEAAQAAGRGWNGLPAVVWEALLAASPVTPEGLSGDWQDISTAPKDGSDVLCYGEYYSNPCRFVAHWNGVQWYAGWGDAIQPTLWQPLPATPAKTV